MNFIKCAKCGREEPAFDYAHVCGPVEVKQTVMNERIRELAKEAGAQGIVNRDFIDVEKFAQLIVRECANYAFSDDQDNKAMLKHFGVE